MSHYIFKSEEDYHFKSKKVSKQLKEDLEFPDRDDEIRLKIATDGTITVKKGYAWDGCSPKFNILDLFWVGTPDGAINENKPVTYYASLVHDALGQFAKKESERMPFNRKERDLIFKEMLEGFALQWLYYLAVRIFGGLYSIFF
ncbi:conserved hypothetical protein [Hyella patelloides LEGE 07179]|uniref:DUF1353 domain-containing protein n=1 Tax=Hyella patelloides LEGE 07179 TaxID=945734 RepID=A0A563VX25_9CYAN|nr:hypothetical protein [Hyella patelloides]VEP15989.1 conserved hypothetical protein [Hyella patelloides LEGE 07179]